jgi:hypothetical protein
LSSATVWSLTGPLPSVVRSTVRSWTTTGGLVGGRFEVEFHHVDPGRGGVLGRERRVLRDGDQAAPMADVQYAAVGPGVVVENWRAGPGRGCRGRGGWGRRSATGEEPGAEQLADAAECSTAGDRGVAVDHGYQ